MKQQQKQNQQIPPPQLPKDISSIKGEKYIWKMNPADDTHVREIAYRHHLSLPVAHVLYNRGYQTSEQIRSFLFTSYQQDVPHSSLLKGIDVVVDRILKAIEKKEKILIFGDYDVDGITSSSIALTALIPLGANINFFLPNRVKDGYGLSVKAVKKAHENNYGLIITVDNGISAYDAANKAQELGIDLIITDHHRPHDDLPPALAIINPQQNDCPYPFKSLAGVGVIFKIMSLIYEKLDKPLPQKMYELMLLGTVADVVPLLDENRYWVRHGLTEVNRNKSFAMQVLAGNAKLTREVFNSLDIGFMIAPQLNALGRLSDPRDGVKFLISSNPDDVIKIGEVLKNINEKRKEVEQGIYQEIEEKITNKTIDLDKEYVIIAGSENWPAGVIGLVAGRLTHNYGRPTILFHFDKKRKLAKGSCRSIQEFNIFDALTKTKDILISFGGHSFAAGLALKQKDLKLFKERLEADMAAQFALGDLQPRINLDAPLTLTDMSHVLLNHLEQLEPFGNKNPQPLFWIKNVTLLKQPQVLKEKHVKISVFSEGIIKPVIFFNRPDLIRFFGSIDDRPFDIAGHVMKNEWNGRVKIELQGIDIALN